MGKIQRIEWEPELLWINAAALLVLLLSVAYAL